MQVFSVLKFKSLVFKLCVIAGVSLVSYNVFAKEKQTAVELYGEISVDNGVLLDQNNNPVQLRGMSLFWSQWGGQFYNKSVVKTLTDDWNISVIRVAIAAKKGGYNTNPQGELKKVDVIVKAAVENGIYVIIDWHSHDAQNDIKSAIEFFETVAKKYGHLPNVIYEIYNEPDYESWNNDIKPYAETVIQKIRAIDDNNLIIVGTPTWSQRVDQAADNPLEGKNIAYTIHFYAGTHSQEIRDNVIYALDKGLAIFSTEWGMSKASGNGGVFKSETKKWIDFFDAHNISWLNWSIINKKESSAALKPSASHIANWTDRDLTKSGKWVKKRLLSY
ncbi:MAG: glycoside hydrolase family 5 protein [Saccharospirillaceae bacterium]|nr:glycoside hydrolase family 5 protein [Pseudomonadales bacterium]NRB78122.1 glycoside hydrolase family 5 protein [Saccharospirillaceae bacterium]